MYIRRLARTLVGVLVVCGMVSLTATIALANSVTFDQVLRPPVSFLEHGDVIGISQEAHTRLGIREGDLVEVTSPLGTKLVVPTRIHGNRSDTVYARKTVRDSLNIDSGMVALSLRPYSANNAVSADGSGIVTFNRVRRPPESFLQYGDVIGISATGLARLGIDEGQTILVRSPGGKTLAARTKVHGTEAETLFLKKTLRDKIEIEDGTIILSVSPVVWPTSPPVSERQTFSRVGRPPASFLELGDVVGISYADMMRLNARPGDEVKLTTERGELDATLEILDREEGTLHMKLTMRRQLGISDGPARVNMEITGRGVSRSSTDEESALFWYRRLDTAQARAKDEGRPLMVFAFRAGHGDSDTVLANMDQADTRRELMPIRKFRFDAGENELLARQYNITRVPTLLYMYPDGREIGRFEGAVSPDRIRAGATHSVRLVREENQSIRDADLE